MNIKNNLRDVKVLSILGITIALIGLHIWQYMKSDDIRALINLIMCSVLVPSIVIGGFNILPYFLLCYCFVYLPVEEFDNYTSLFLLFSATSLNKKLRFCFIPYVVETISVYMINGLEISHVTISLLYILFFWQIYVYIQDRHADVTPLDLKEDEIRILQELAKGKQQKEIDFYSHVTVSKKLKEARERNNCISTDELVTKYKSTNQIN